MLEAESDVGIHRRRYPDLGKTQQLFDDDEFDALFQEGVAASP